MRLAALLVIVAGILVAQPAVGQTQADKEAAACRQANLGVGARSPLDLNSCYKDYVDATNKANGVVCPGFSNACCVNGAVAKCIALSVTGSFVPAVYDQPVQTGSGSGKLNCPQGVDPHDSTRCATVPLTFTPNVPIPGGVFDETQQVDSTLFARYLGAFFVYFIGVIGVLSVVMVMWGGYHYIVSQGNASRMKQGKETIVNSIIGLALALLSFLLLSLINPQLVSFRGIVPEFLAGRFQPLEHTTVPLKQGTRVVSGDFSTIAGRVKAHPDWIAEIRAQGTTAVPSERILAILFIESAGIEDAQSSAGALGLMQLLPSTARQYGVANSQDLFNGVTNIKAGSAYLKALAAKTCPDETSKTKCKWGNPCINGDFAFINAAYNGGRAANYCSQTCPGKTWSQCVENEGYAETRNYIEKANTAYAWIVSNPLW